MKNMMSPLTKYDNAISIFVSRVINALIDFSDFRNHGSTMWNMGHSITNYRIYYSVTTYTCQMSTILDSCLMLTVR